MAERVAEARASGEQLLRIGEFTCALSTGALGPIRRSGQELVRRIFVTVRDARWAETAPCEWHVEPTDTGARFSARHKTAEVDFTWTGELVLAADGRSADFRISGQAHRDMSVCRLGLIVLLPVETVVGSRLSVDGQVLTEAVSPTLAPQPIVDGLPSGMSEPFSELLLGPSDAPKLRLQLDGDLFELEDQRNWGDASFKVYCTPLRLGFPRPVAAGSRIEHSLRAEFGEDGPAASDRRAQATQTARAPALSLLVAGLDSQVLQSADRLTVNAAELGSGALRPLLENGRPPRLDLQLSEEALSQPPEDFLAALRESAQSIVSVRLTGVSLPSQDAVAQVRQMMARAGIAQVPLLVGTSGYFVEFNRAEPFSLEGDGVTFPASPTVHSDSLATALENGETIGEMINAARALTGARTVAISPLTWAYPPRSEQDFDPEAAVLWGLSAVISAARAGAEVVSLGPDLAAAFSGQSPAGAWLGALMKAADSPLLPIAGPAKVSFAAFASGAFLAANLTRESQTIQVPRGTARFEAGQLSDGADCGFTCTGDLVLPPLTAACGELSLTPSLARAVEAPS